MSYKDPDLRERQSGAAAARKAALEKFRAASEDPGVAKRLAERAEIHKAREGGVAEREAARKVREAELAAEAARHLEIERQKELEAQKAAEMIAAEEAENGNDLAAEQNTA